MKKAQNIYIEKYKIDITDAYSTSNLSLKIFRTHFLKDKEIPILKHSEDNYIRESYYGGATDYYKAYAENIKYYDVNSLYPYAMLKPMPHKFLGIKYNINLNNFFGFIYCKIECPDSIKRPMLPVKYNNQTIFPHGK